MSEVYINCNITVQIAYTQDLLIWYVVSFLLSTLYLILRQIEYFEEFF